MLSGYMIAAPEAGPEKSGDAVFADHPSGGRITLSFEVSEDMIDFNRVRRRCVYKKSIRLVQQPFSCEACLYDDFLHLRAGDGILAV